MLDCHKPIVQVFLFDETQMVDEQLQLLCTTPLLGSKRAKQMMLAIGHFHAVGASVQHQIGMMTIAAGTRVPQLDRMLPTEYQPERSAARCIARKSPAAVALCKVHNTT